MRVSPIYKLIAYLLLTYGTIPEGGFAGDLADTLGFRLIIWLAAAGSFVTLPIFQARFLSADAIRGRVRTPVESYLNTWHIVLFAMAGSIAVYGFLLFLIGALLEDFLVLTDFSLLTFYRLRPQEEEYLALVRSILHT